MKDSADCNCTQDTLCLDAKNLFHELAALQRAYASEYEQEVARTAFYEHRALAGFSARGMLSDRRT